MEVQRKPRVRIVWPGSVSCLLIVLKLTGVIAWSWWVVLLPLWLPVAIVLPFGAFFFWSKGIDRLNEWMAEWRIRRKHAGDNPGLWR